MTANNAKIGVLAAMVLSLSVGCTNRLNGLGSILSASNSTQSSGNTTTSSSLPAPNPPGALVYGTTLAAFTVNAAITNDMPNLTDPSLMYSVTPPLPAGLTLSPTTGIISGTPTAVNPLATYVIQASNSAGLSVTSLNFAVYPVPITVNTWAFKDGSNPATGLNANASDSAINPTMVSFNYELYLTWTELNANGVYELRFAVYNGNDAQPGIAFLDGGAGTGLNFNAAQSAMNPQFAVANSKLYLTWAETDGGVTQIRVAVYNGNDAAPAWTFVDGKAATGLNVNTAQQASASELISFNNELYLTWTEQAGNPNDAQNEQVHVKVYNGNDAAPAWTFVDGKNATGGVNFGAKDQAELSQFAVLNNKLYLVWDEDAGSDGGAPVNTIRAAVYNGNDATPVWTFVDGDQANGLTHVADGQSAVASVAVFNGKLYGIWEDLAPNQTTLQMRTAVYNGNDAAPAWSYVDGNAAAGINYNTNVSAYEGQLISYGGNLYAAWTEEDAANAYKIRVARYNGNDAAGAWALIDGDTPNGLNLSATSSALYPNFTVFGNEIYGAWSEEPGNVSEIRFVVGTP